MSDLILTVHRSTTEIGGNCIELRVGDDRLILDVGRPLDAPSDAVGLLPKSLDLSGPPAHVVISHPHQDHYGLIGELPASWPVYAAPATEALIRLTSRLFGTGPSRNFARLVSGASSSIGCFSVKPILIDHSAFDAHMLLIEGGGKRVLYTGDFRRHGRKAGLVDRLMQDPPSSIDILLMEGTNLGSNKPSRTEAGLEDDFVDLFQQTSGRVFVAWSAQNVDRTVTLYRAALKTGRTLVVDLYTAEVMTTLAEFGRLPQPDWAKVKVIITPSLARMYRRRGESDFVDRMAVNGVSARTLEKNGGRWVVMIRPSLARDLAKSGVTITADDAWSFSQWSGYLTQPDGRALEDWFSSGGASAKHIHTSGHASPNDLRAFAAAISPGRLVPIHGVSWDGELPGFPPIRRLADGEPMRV